MPALTKASRTGSKLSGGVRTSHASPSSRRSSAPASRTMESILSSSASSLDTTMSPLRLNIQPTAPFSAMFPPFLFIMWRSSLTMRLRFVLTTLHISYPPLSSYPSIVISSHFFDDHAHTTGAVALERCALILLAFERLGAARQGSFNIFVRHVF